MAEDYPVIDLELEDLPVVDLSAPQGKPRPAPPRPKQKVRKNPRQPIKPIKVTPEMRDATMAALDSEMARRLLAEQGQESADETKLNTLNVFGQGGVAGMALERTINESREDLKLRQMDTSRKAKEVIKSSKGRAVRRAATGQKITPFEEQLIRTPDERDLPDMPDTSIKPSNRFASNAAAFLQPLAQMGPMTVEGVVEFMDLLGNIGQSEAEAKKTAIAPSVKKYTGDASSFLRGAMPVDEKYPETNLLGGLGSAAGFAGAGLTGKALRIPSFVTTAIVGAGINIADVLREADRMGIDPKRRDASLMLAAATGLTEMAGLGKMIEGFGLSRSFARRMFEIAEEGGQEGLQQWLNNINAAVVGGYDPKRPLTKDVLESIILGAAVGGVFQGVSYGKQKLDARGQQPPTPPTLPARIPPPLAAVDEEPKLVGRALPSSGRVAPMADMGLMAEDKPPTPGEIDEIFATLDQERMDPIERKARELAKADGIDWDSNPQYHMHYEQEAYKDGPSKKDRNKAAYNKMFEIADELGLDWDSADPTIRWSIQNDYELLNQFLQGGRFTGQEDARHYAELIGRAQVLASQDPNAVNPVTGEKATASDWHGFSYDDKLDYIAEAIRIYNLNPAPPNPQVRPFNQQQVEDLNAREDNLLEWLRDAQTFDKAGNPMVMHIPSMGRGEPITLDARNFDSGKMRHGITVYQDPEAAFDTVNKKTSMPTDQDMLDDPDFSNLYVKKLEEQIESWRIKNNKFEGEIPAKAMDVLRSFARNETKNALLDKYLRTNKNRGGIARSYNLQPYYVNITNPFDLEKPFTPEEVANIRRGMIQETIEWHKKNGFTPEETENALFNLEDSALQVLEEFAADERMRVEEVTGAVIEAEMGKWLTYLNSDTPFQKRIQRALELAGYDGMKYLHAEGYPKEFRTPEEAQEYADKVGGVFQLEPGYVTGPSEWVDVEVTDPATGQVSTNSVQETPISKGPTVYGSTAWLAWKGTQLKSATGNTGEYSPSNQEVYRADGGMAIVPRVANPPATFDVLPALGGETGNAPSMLVPRWAMQAIGYPSNRGVNLSLNQLGTTLKQIRKAAPTDNDRRKATQALFDLVEQSIDEGLNTFSLIPSDQPEADIHRAVEHETFHAAQRAGLVPKENWVLNHPMLRKILHRPIVNEIYKEGQTKPRGDAVVLPSIKEMFFSSLNEKDALAALAMEIPPYTIEGRLDILGMSPAEGLDFTFDVYNHLRTEYGPDGIARLRSLTRMRPAMVEALDLSQQMWETHQMELNLEDETDFQWDPDVMASFQGALSAEAPLTPQGKPGGFSRIRNWFSTKKGRKTIQDNPPMANVPEEEAIINSPPPPGPPPPPGRGPGGGAQGPLGPLFKQQVSPEYSQLLTRTFTKMLQQGGIDADPTGGPPFLQVVRAIEDGKLRDVDVDAILEEEGIVWDVFGELLQETASDAGKTLQAYSEIARFWNQIIDEWEVSEGIEKPKGGATGPKLPGSPQALLRLVPIEFQVRRALRGVRNTALGKNWWQRAGNITQKAMLTQISTYTVNTMTSTTQLPLRVATQGLGGWMYQMAEGKGSFGQRLAHANEDARHAMRASMEVIVAMNPAQIAQWLRGRTNSTKFAEYQNIIHQLETKFPDIHKKLFALSGGTETLKKGKRQLSIAKALVAQVKDKATREKLLEEMEKYEERLRQNVEGLGSVFNKAEAMYDFFLQPMQIAEYFLRRPMFVGQLTLELQRENVNLAHVLAHNAFDQIPPEIIERAVNRALEFTYAYMPGTKTGTNYAVEQAVEKAAAHVIEGLNKWGGPLNALFGEPFGKAMFNGAKFVYEYSPLGGILPANRITKNWDLQDQAARMNTAARMGNQAARDLKIKGVINDPRTGLKIVAKPTNQEDYDRLAKAMLGTLMYATVYYFMHTYGGDEWWQVKTGEKGPDGRPIYYDIRRLKPMSTMFQVVDLVERIRDDRLGDQNALAITGEILTGIRMFDNQMGGMIFESMADWFRNEDAGAAGDIAQEHIGRAFATYLTPLVNLRDMIAQFEEEENVKKDTRGSYSVVGPMMDKIPFLRQFLPNLTSPVEPGPIKLSESPLKAQFLGERTQLGKNFAGREWERLGLFNKSFIGRDPDPIINRAQNEAFLNLTADLAAEFEKDPAYLSANDQEKKTMWEIFIGGEDGLAAAAREIGEMANPNEAMRRAMKAGSGMGRFQRESTGYDKMVDEAFPKK